MKIAPGRRIPTDTPKLLIIKGLVKICSDRGHRRMFTSVQRSFLGVSTDEMRVTPSLEVIKLCIEVLPATAKHKAPCSSCDLTMARTMTTGARRGQNICGRRDDVFIVRSLQLL